MDIRELKVLLYRSYALGFESGVNSGNHHDMQVSWGRQKYFFEKDIENQQADSGGQQEDTFRCLKCDTLWFSKESADSCCN